MSVSPFSSLKELGEALRKREVTSTELTSMYLKRLRTLGKDHRAVVTLTEELAMKQAKEADSR